MGSLTHRLLLAVMLAAISVSSSASKVTGNSIENSTQLAGSGRSSRKDYVSFSQPDQYASQLQQKQQQSVYYSPGSSDDDDDGDADAGFRPSGIVDRPPKDDDGDTSTPTYYEGYYRPPPQPKPRYYASGPLYKSASSTNWNVWKGDPMDNAPAPPPAPQTDKGGPPPPDFGEYYVPADAWKGDPWTPEQMSAMMMMMNQMQAAQKPKFGGLLSKLTQDPGVLLVAAILPLTVLLAAVMPTLVNMMMNGGLPTITTTATGNSNSGGGRGLEGAEFLSPVLTTISTFGARAFEDPDCMQRIFCQVTRGPRTNGTDSGRSFQRSVHTASRLVDSSWLEAFGLKTLFDAMGDGDCDRIPCSHHERGLKSSSNKKENNKT